MIQQVPVFYDERMVAQTASFSPSAAKPREVVSSWRELGLPISIIAPTPVTANQLALAHRREYVQGVLNGRLPNGFGNKLHEVASSLPWTSGAMLSAARAALANGCVAAAPVAGFHHAH